MLILTNRDEQRLEGLHHDLVRVVRRVALNVPSGVGFAVLEGMRTLARQKQLVASGASQTMKSRHLDGHAVDLGCTVNGQVEWAWPLYNRLALVVKEAAHQENVPIEWGGDWTSFKDGPHWQLPWDRYPSPTATKGTP